MIIKVCFNHSARCLWIRSLFLRGWDCSSFRLKRLFFFASVLLIDDTTASFTFYAKNWDSFVSRGCLNLAALADFFFFVRLGSLLSSPTDFKISVPVRLLPTSFSSLGSFFTFTTKSSVSSSFSGHFSLDHSFSGFLNGEGVKSLEVPHSPF